MASCEVVEISGYSLQRRKIQSTNRRRLPVREGMGNETSKSSSSDSSSGEGSSSRLARYSKRLHRPRRHRSVIKCDSDPLTKAVSQLDFAGIASIQLIKVAFRFCRFFFPVGRLHHALLSLCVVYSIICVCCLGENGVSG